MRSVAFHAKAAISQQLNPLRCTTLRNRWGVKDVAHAIPYTTIIVPISAFDWRYGLMDSTSNKRTAIIQNLWRSEWG